MKEFSALIDALIFTPSRNGKLRHLTDYFAQASDPDRGYALAALTGSLDLKAAKPALVRGLVAERVDPVLFGWSYDYVGDLAETVALIWPEEGEPKEASSLRLSDVVVATERAGKADMPALLASWLDGCAISERYALIKLITGGMRMGVSARLAKVALAQFGDRPVEEIEELWHGLEPPYEPLFAWLEGKGDRPVIDDALIFRPLMLAHPLEEGEEQGLSAEDFAAEWKWDGIRVQLAARGGETKLFSRTGDDISNAFPDVLANADFHAVLDGELLVVREGEVQPFSHLQKRLNRKKVGAKMLADFPGWIRLYDILFDGEEDLRALPFHDRRQRLEAWYAIHEPNRMDISPTVHFTDWAALDELRAGARGGQTEGVMIKRLDSVYVAGRPKGAWFKWKRGPLLVDCVLMYAQRGHGKRSSFYSDYTFGLWREDGTLVPVGKAYFGFTDEELAQLDKFVRANTLNRFGPVREVAQELVFEVAFDSVHASTRHKSGLAMRFPRINRIRWDKPAAEADHLEVLQGLAEG
ncbi:MAG: cisplatin damage response ATP-dependent DNA ligase [Pseudomonadota bacterium]